MQRPAPAKAFRKAVVVALLGTMPSLVAADAKHGLQFQQAIAYIESKQYDKALPLLEELAKTGNKAAMYRLAYLYEKGLGVPQDFKKAARWYKEAAGTYAYTMEAAEKGNDIHAGSIAERLKAQFEPGSLRAAGEAAIAKVDTDTPETRSFLNDLANGRFFGLTPYKANYILPLGYAARKYNRQPSAYKNYAIYDRFMEQTTGINPDLEGKYGQYDKQTEVEFQISLKKNLTYNLFGFNEYITAAYTQRCFWQLYSPSGPFRETNYMPELYVAVPTSADVDAKTGLKVTKWGFIHQSNGQEGYRSRSWNRLYLEGMFQWSNLFLSARVWYRLPESDKSEAYYRGWEYQTINGKLVQVPYHNPNESGDDNPDILDYMGYGDLSLSYLWRKHQFGGLFRYNFGRGGYDRGAVQLDWSYPFFDSKTTFWYFKFFNGYGESLIDYNRNVTKTSFGFAFSRGLFQ